MEDLRPLDLYPVYGTGRRLGCRLAVLVPYKVDIRISYMWIRPVLDN